MSQICGVRGGAGRRWTLAPDSLEYRRKVTRLKFIGVNSVYRIANGGITLHPFDRGGIELSLMGYVIADRFLWASDYSQTVREASAYATDVWHAAQRDELHPEHTAAEHLPLTPWTTIKGLQK